MGLENAIRHPTNAVAVTLARHNGHIEVHVDDDDGAGLGLPLARHRETTRPGGYFVLRLPALT